MMDRRTFIASLAATFAAPNTAFAFKEGTSIQDIREHMLAEYRILFKYSDGRRGKWGGALTFQCENIEVFVKNLIQQKTDGSPFRLELQSGLYETSEGMITDTNITDSLIIPSNSDFSTAYAMVRNSMEGLAIKFKERNYGGNDLILNKLSRDIKEQYHCGLS